MIERVLLVAWKGSTATTWVETLKSGGYTVLLEDTTGERAWRTAKERGIDVVIIDGQKKPSHGRQTGHALRDTAKTRNIPIIWTNLEDEDKASVQAEVKPDVALTAPTDAASALSALQSLHAQRAINEEQEEEVPETTPEPVVLESVSVSVSVAAATESSTTVQEVIETVEEAPIGGTITLIERTEAMVETVPIVAEAPAPEEKATGKKVAPTKRAAPKKAAKKPVTKAKTVKKVVKKATAAKKATTKKAPAKKALTKKSARKKK